MSRLPRQKPLFPDFGAFKCLRAFFVHSNVSMFRLYRVNFQTSVRLAHFHAFTRISCVIRALFVLSKAPTSKLLSVRIFCAFFVRLSNVFVGFFSRSKLSFISETLMRSKFLVRYSCVEIISARNKE